ncbi:agmatine deiminase family protein [Mycolicibacterium fluoranthenivorans]|uniref:Agmatine deiminase n=1 Tax=Mycolicibacterium fluoranthenivorans TaxID=258505 RepID=A0A7X5ZAL8_9MYCO|nr:agmatine deiminase family protein [Mycolicibacterium fluoranthenivorans]MCV7359131.1 agmatine deiminase family protein [Mycolicibacterium fluoranthenivorans]NIH93685.1 agmatine deiminase [Mycolicibacterium fluoranthenivorans]
MTYLMPAEAAPQDRVWMAFPSAGYSLGDTESEHHEARSTWAAVAHAIAEFEPVTMLVDPAELTAAKRYVSQSIEIVEAPLNDAWMRDIGPTFVHAEDGSVAAVNWVFNGWGAQDWARWDRDEKIGATVAELAGVPIVNSELVNEGGGIQVDGHGTVLVTETVQLDPGRNPGLGKAQVEAELARTIGATDVVWLPRGLTRDSQRFGTRGHVDIVAAITAPGRLLLHTQTADEHPDTMVCKEIRHALEDRFDIVDMPAPDTLTDAEGYVDYSYINHLVVNGGVIACSFGDPRDADAAAILAEQYPGRTVVGVDARPLFERGGGIHCITQQQPSPNTERA